MKGTIETSRDILWCDVGSNVEGDNNATTLTLTIDKLYNGIDLSDFLFTMRFSNRDIVLNKKVEEDKIYLSLNIDKMMSDKPGLKPFYISMVKGETIIYSKMSKVYFNKKGFENAPEYEEDILEDYLNQIREMIRKHQEEMEEQLNTIDDKINEEIEEAIDKLLKEIKEEATQAVEEALEDIKENVDKIVEESLERVLDAKLEPIINKVEEVSNEVIELKEDVDGLVLRVVELEEVAGKVNEELLQHQTCLDELKENLTLTDETLSKLKETVSQNKTEVDTKLDNINKTIANDKEELKGLIKALETLHSKDRNELDKRINQNGEDIQALNNRLAFMIKDIADNKVKIDDLSLEVEELTSDIKEIKIKHEEDITKLQTDIEANKEIIEALKLDVEKFEAKVEVIEESIKTMQDDIEDLKVNGGGGGGNSVEVIGDYLQPYHQYYRLKQVKSIGETDYVGLQEGIRYTHPLLTKALDKIDYVKSSPVGVAKDKYGEWLQCLTEDEEGNLRITIFKITEDMEEDYGVKIKKNVYDIVDEGRPAAEITSDHENKRFLYLGSNEGGKMYVQQIDKEVFANNEGFKKEVLGGAFENSDDVSNEIFYPLYHQIIEEDSVFFVNIHPSNNNAIILHKLSHSGQDIFQQEIVLPEWVGGKKNGVRFINRLQTVPTQKDLVFVQSKNTREVEKELEYITIKQVVYSKDGDLKFSDEKVKDIPFRHAGNRKSYGRNSRPVLMRDEVSGDYAIFAMTYDRGNGAASEMTILFTRYELNKNSEVKIKSIYAPYSEEVFNYEGGIWGGAQKYTDLIGYINDADAITALYGNVAVSRESVGASRVKSIVSMRQPYGKEVSKDNTPYIGSSVAYGYGYETEKRYAGIPQYLGDGKILNSPAATREGEERKESAIVISLYEKEDDYHYFKEQRI